jgi:hypothetical protein
MEHLKLQLLRRVLSRRPLMAKTRMVRSRNPLGSASVANCTSLSTALTCLRRSVNQAGVRNRKSKRRSRKHWQKHMMVSRQLLNELKQSLKRIPLLLQPLEVLPLQISQVISLHNTIPNPEVLYWLIRHRIHLPLSPIYRKHHTNQLIYQWSWTP